jgi:hypothetical protein
MIGNESLVEIANSCSSIQGSMDSMTVFLIYVAISIGWNTRFTADLLVDLAVKSNLSLKKVV